MKEYFSHDYYAREDEKIRNLMFAHNWTGYGIYWAIIEMLYQNGGYMQLHYNRIAFELRTEETIIDSIINDFDLFKIKGDKFTSESVLRRIKLREEKSDTYKTNALKRWNTSKKKDATAMQLHSNSNAIKEKKRKENNKYIFSDFWDSYHEITQKVKTDKEAAQKYWNKLKEQEKQKAIEMIKPYFLNLTDTKYCKKARTYLADKNFNDEYTVNKGSPEGTSTGKSFGHLGGFKENPNWHDPRLPREVE